MKSIIVLLLIQIITISGFSQRKPPAPKVKPDSVIADSIFFLGNYKEAISIYQRLLSKDKFKKRANWWSNLGTSFKNAKDYPNALSAYQRAEELNPSLRGLGLNMARVYSSMGDVTMAIAKIDSARSRFGFGNFILLDGDQELANLRTDPRFEELKKRVRATGFPCENDPEATKFNFWLGSWDVYLTANPTTKVGTNQITKMSGGCVILESWQASTSVHNGVSINYFDPTSRKWNQKWAGSSQDIIEFYEGEYKDGALRFKWDVPNGTNPPLKGRLTFTDLSGKVRQHSESSSDDGKTWSTIYDFTYVRKN